MTDKDLFEEWLDKCPVTFTKKWGEQEYVFHFCEHTTTEYIEPEPDINVSEDVVCIECGESIIDQIERNEDE